jgi:predicted ATPase/predicted negative regulator of RcsB-dependent stress response
VAAELRHPTRTNLLPEATSFVGRARELDLLAACLKEGVRVLTLLGPAGVGKTRLAQRLGQELLGGYEGGVWFCDLASARGLEPMVLAVASVLGLLDSAAPTVAALSQRVASALASRPKTLLILDNFEQLPPEATVVVASWVDAAMPLTLLVTSRSRLRVAMETVWELEPLGLPREGDDPQSSEAVALFTARAQAAGLAIGPKSAPTIAAIVRRLEGMPLAIELCAARARALGPQGVLERLADRFALLDHPGSDLTDRQATLSGALEWSWELLTPSEQAAFATSGVFSGGFDLEAFQAVLGAEPADALCLIESLLDRSLCRGLPDLDRGTIRFHLYEAIRELAVKKLGTVRAEVELRHARHYVALGERLSGTRLESERENLLAVIERAPDALYAARALLALDPLLSVRGPYERHLALSDQVLAKEAELPPPITARLLAARGNVRRMAGRTSEALDDLQRALRIAEADGDPVLVGPIAHDLGVAWHARDAFDDAQSRLDQALTLARQTGDRRLEGRALGSLAIMAHDGGRFEEAQTHYEWALVLCGEARDTRSLGVFRSNLGDLHLEHGRPAEARGAYQKALELMRAVGDRRVEAVILGNLGAVAQAEGDLEQAWRLRLLAIERLEEVGDSRLAGVFRGYLGTVAHERGDSEAAGEAYRQAIHRAAEAESPRYEGLFRACLGALRASRAPAVARDELERARALLEPLGDCFLGLAWELHAAHLAGGWAAAPSPEEVLARARRPTAPQGDDPWPGPPLSAQSEEVRFAIRLLEGAVGPAPNAPPRVLPALAIARDGRAFRAPAGEWVDLGRRRSLRLLIDALARARLESPGRGLDLEGLRAIGWPGERMLPEAAANRVYVALASLRKMGLRQVLISRDDGYLFDPTVELTLVDDPP